MTAPETPAEQLVAYYDLVLAQARSLAPRLAARGHEQSDLAQFGFVYLLSVTMPRELYDLSDEDRNRYVSASIRRKIIRMARGETFDGTGSDADEADETILTRLEDRGHPFAAAVVVDLIQNAPADVAAWLEATGVDGLSINEARVALDWTRHRTETARMEAAAWLLKQVEGSR